MENKKTETTSTGFWAALVLSFLFILLGGALLLIDGFSMLWISYLIAAYFCSSGIISICTYFIRKEYLDLDKYGFSAGLFSMLLGLCIFIRAEDIAGIGIELSGVLLLLHSVILLQYAVQVYMMEGRAAGVLMFFTAVEDIVAIIIMTEPKKIFITYPKAYDWALIICGLLGLVSMLLVRFRRFNLKKETERDRERILEDEPVSDVVVAETEIIKEEESE